MKSIFLSHSSIDKPTARKIKAYLQDSGVDAWLDESEIVVGDLLNEKINEALEQADYFGLLLSRNSMKSISVQKELEIAHEREKRDGRVHILPIMLDDCEIPNFLEGRVYADFRQSFRDGMTVLLRKLSGTRRIETPHHPTIRSYEVPISASSDDQLIGLQQDDGHIFFQWSEGRPDGYEVYVHKIEKKSLAISEAIGFELPGVHWSGFLKKYEENTYCISISELEYRKRYQVWRVDVNDPDAEPELWGETANPHIDDVAMIGNCIVVVGLLRDFLIVDVLERGKKAKTYKLTARESIGVCSLVVDDGVHKIIYMCTTGPSYHEINNNVEPGNQTSQYGNQRYYLSGANLFHNCIHFARGFLATLVSIRGDERPTFEFIEHSKEGLRHSQVHFFNELKHAGKPFKHSMAASDDVILVTWNSHEEEYRYAILSTMLFDKKTLRPIWKYPRNLTSFSNCSSGVPILFDENLAYLGYIEEAEGQFKIKISEIDVSMRIKASHRIKRWG